MEDGLKICPWVASRVVYGYEGAGVTRWRLMHIPIEPLYRDARIQREKERERESGREGGRVCVRERECMYERERPARG